MRYTKAPFSLTHTENETFLYSQKGIFVIDNPAMITLVQSLLNVSFIDEHLIRKTWEGAAYADINFEDVISYLTKEIQILIELQPGFVRLEPCFVSSDSLPDKVIKTLFQEESIVKRDEFQHSSVFKERKLFVIDMIRAADTEAIEEIQMSLNAHSTCIFIFLIGDHFVISHAYSKSVMHPCILCLYDYVMERVLSDNKNKISSLASVIDYINGNYNIPAPGALTDELDLLYLMREIKQYILTLTGNGRCAFTGCNVNQAKIINIHTLEKMDLVIPFSPLCNCIQHYHLIQG
ncbi:hypothetical protein QM999_06070 [Pectobacterium cacticida]|uniref:hypothetical protein n=1 Tax=Pectobacterium cacticida TaxID=69221 RepID=UPI002FF2187F